MRTYLFIALALLFCSGCRKKESLVDTELRFTALEDGTEFSLQEIPNSIHKLMVNFYAPDCPPCEKEIGALKKFHEKYRENSSVGFIAIGSSLKAIDVNPRPGKDPPLSIADIKKDLVDFKKKYSITYPQFIAESQALTAWRVTGFPETFIFIRRDNRLELTKKIISEVTLDILENELQLK